MDLSPGNQWETVSMAMDARTIRHYSATTTLKLARFTLRVATVLAHNSDLCR